MRHQLSSVTVYVEQETEMILTATVRHKEGLWNPGAPKLCVVEPIAQSLSRRIPWIKMWSWLGATE